MKKIRRFRYELQMRMISFISSEQSALLLNEILIKLSRLLGSRFVLLSVMINFILEKPLSTTASDWGMRTNNRNKIFTFGKADSITPSLSKSKAFNGDLHFASMSLSSISRDFNMLFYLFLSALMLLKWVVNAFFFELNSSHKTFFWFET